MPVDTLPEHDSCLSFLNFVKNLLAPNHPPIRYHLESACTLFLQLARFLALTLSDIAIKLFLETSRRRTPGMVKTSCMSVGKCSLILGEKYD